MLKIWIIKHIIIIITLIGIIIILKNTIYLPPYTKVVNSCSSIYLNELYKLIHSNIILNARVTLHWTQRYCETSLKLMLRSFLRQQFVLPRRKPNSGRGRWYFFKWVRADLSFSYNENYQHYVFIINKFNSVIQINMSIYLKKRIWLNYCVA